MVITGLIVSKSDWTYFSYIEKTQTWIIPPKTLKISPLDIISRFNSELPNPALVHPKPLVRTLRPPNSCAACGEAVDTGIDFTMNYTDQRRNPHGKSMVLMEAPAVLDLKSSAIFMSCLWWTLTFGLQKWLVWKGGRIVNVGRDYQSNLVYTLLTAIPQAHEESQRSMDKETNLHKYKYMFHTKHTNYHNNNIH